MAFFFGESVSILGLFIHFVPHYASLFFLAAILDKWWSRGVWLLFSAVTLFWLYCPFLPQSKLPLEQKMIFYNVKIDNSELKRDLEILTQTWQTNLLALAEMDISSLPKNLDKMFHYRCGTEREGIFGLVFLSRQLLISCQVKFVKQLAFIRAENKNSIFYLLHPPPPIGGLTDIHLQYLQGITKEIEKDTQHTNKSLILIGDFNQSPFSSTFLKFKEKTHTQTVLKNYSPTWLPAFIHIDHFLVARLTHFQGHVLPWLHSDHRPIYLTWSDQ